MLGIEALGTRVYSLLTHRAIVSLRPEQAVHQHDRRALALAARLGRRVVPVKGEVDHIPARARVREVSL